MLSISGITNVDYYEKMANDSENSNENANENYYSEAQEAAGRYYGKGSQMLGLKGELQQGHLAQLLQGFNPETGEKVASNAGEDHRKGWDLTFSAPKSYSLLLSDGEHRDKAIDLHRQAVGKAVEYIENNVVNCREGAQGQELTNANLICAGYTHTSSRELDMQLHEHLLVNSHALNDQGESKSIDGRRLMDFKEAAGAIYRTELAKLTTQELGLKTERDGQSFRIVGNTQAFEKEQSKRREQIKEKLEEKGLKGGKASAAASLDTRKTKVHANKDELQDVWKNEADKHNYNVENLLEQQQEIDVKNEYNIDDVIDKLTDNDSAFTQATLHKTIAQEMQCIDSDLTIEDRINDLKENGEIISLGIDDRTGLKQFTTQHMLDLENSIKDFADKTQNNTDFEIKDVLISKTAEEFTLNQEQEEAYKSLLGKGQFVSTIGAGGTGKTHMLNAVKSVYESKGYEVKGLAPTGKVAANLTADGIDSSTLDSFLLGVKYGNIEVNNKTVLMLDEAAMVHTKNYNKLKEVVEENGCKLINVGDAEQIQAVQAGGVFNLLTKDNNSVVELVQNMRQKENWQKEAANNFRSGNTKGALQAYASNDCLHIEKTDRKTINKIVNKYNNIDSSKNEKLIFATKNSDIDKINRAVRTSLKKDNKLNISTNIQSSNGKLEIAIGDRITATKNVSKKLHGMKSKEVLNGDLGTIKDININEKGETVLKVELDRGKTVSINTNNYNELRHAYCISSHRSQGSTYKNGLMYVSGSFSNKEMGYVMASRHKESLEIFSSEETLLSKNKDLKDTIATSNMIKFAETLAEENGIELKGDDFNTVRDYLNEHSDLELDNENNSDEQSYDKSYERLVELLSKEDKKLTAVERVKEHNKELDTKKDKELKELLKELERQRKKKKYNKEEKDLEDEEGLDDKQEKEEIKETKINVEDTNLNNDNDNVDDNDINNDIENVDVHDNGLNVGNELDLQLEVDI